MANHVAEPTQMHVTFALFEGDELLQRGEFLIGLERAFGVYGEQSTFPLPAVPPFSDRLQIQLFAGLTIEHSFELPACPVTLCYYLIDSANDNQLPRQIRRFRAALQMGVHASDDWESLELPPYTFAFKCSMPISALTSMA